jgi:2-methylcitrate dehydratase PrpD
LSTQLGTEAESPASAAVGATAALARAGHALSLSAIPADALAVAKQCVLDWLGVTLAGSREPLSEVLSAELAGGNGDEATLIGRSDRASVLAAALVNGAAGHALDFDDTHLTMMGHPTVPVAPAVVALAERLDSSGAELVTAFVAGVEVECRLGALLGPSHYARGWHATGTLGTFGAAAGCARLLELDEERWCHALGIAGTQAAGLKGVFGTMCKPLHAGKAAANGLLGATLAARGFTSNPQIVEAHQGFGETHAESIADVETLEPLAGRFLVRETLFKYHAACYLTHAVIEGALRLRHEHAVAPDEVEAVEVEVNPGVLDVANIREPRTGLEGKFSLGAVTAMALLGDDTTDPRAYSDQRMTETDLVAMRDRVRVATDDEVGAGAGTVRLRTTDGRELSASADTSVPAAELDRQRERLRTKFQALAAPIAGDERAAAIARMVDGLEDLERVRELTRVCGA